MGDKTISPILFFYYIKICRQYVNLVIRGTEFRMLAGVRIQYARRRKKFRPTPSKGPSIITARY